MVTLALDLTVTQHGRFVKLDAASMDSLSKWYFLWMKIFPTGLVDNLFRLVSQYVCNRVGGVQDAGIESEIYSILAEYDKGPVPSSIPTYHV